MALCHDSMFSARVSHGNQTQKSSDVSTQNLCMQGTVLEFLGFEQCVMEKRMMKMESNQ
jgi:hypothetical protein